MANRWSGITAIDVPAAGAWRLWMAAVLFLLLGCLPPAWAAPVAGVVVQLSGPLLAKKANGAVRILAVKSEVESGDTLVTEKNTYALVRFIDSSEITLRPGSTMTIEHFSFAGDRPDGDAAKFSLVKGGLRSVTGLLGKRSREKFEMKTPAATIGIRGTTFIAEFVPPPDGMAAPGPRAPGLYVQVQDGVIVVANGAGSAQFAAGQFGYTPGLDQPPVVLPADPGMRFTPPPAFDGAGGSVDCEVR